MDAKKENRLADETTCLMEKYKLPDGRVIRFDRERFQAAEVLFSPPDSDMLGVADMLYVWCMVHGACGLCASDARVWNRFDMIQHKAAMDLRSRVRHRVWAPLFVLQALINSYCRVVQLYRQVVLSGGSTMYPGFSTRLHHDVQQSYLREVLKGNKSRLSVRHGRGALHTWWYLTVVFVPLQNFKLRIEDPPRRKHMVFMGASVYAKLMAERHDFWMSRAEYAEEGGERLVQRKLGRLVL